MNENRKYIDIYKEQFLIDKTRDGDACTDRKTTDKTEDRIAPWGEEVSIGNPASHCDSYNGAPECNSYACPVNINLP